MSTAVVIPSSNGSVFLQEALTALRECPIPIMVLREGPVSSWEIGQFEWAVRNTTLDYIIYLQDTMIVKDIALIDMFLDIPGPVGLCNCPVPFGMFMGKFDRKQMESLTYPKVTNKTEAVQSEIWLGLEMNRMGDYPALFPELHDVNATEVRTYGGRENLILENDYVIKYKSTWEHAPDDPFDIQIGSVGKKWAEAAKLLRKDEQ